MSDTPKPKELHKLADNKVLLEVGRRAIEDVLVEWRDSRLSEPLRRNGLVIAERDGSRSSIIRFGPETALRIGLRAIADHLRARESTLPPPPPSCVSPTSEDTGAGVA